MWDLELESVPASCECASRNPEDLELLMEAHRIFAAGFKDLGFVVVIVLVLTIIVLLVWGLESSVRNVVPPAGASRLGSKNGRGFTGSG